MVQWLRALVILPEDMGLSPTVVHKSSSRGSDNLFWPPWAWDTHEVHINTGRKTLRYIKKNPTGKQLIMRKVFRTSRIFWQG